MFYLILAILGSIAIPTVIRTSTNKAKNKYGMFLFNYFTSFCLSLIFTGEFKPFGYGDKMIPVFIVGAISGFFYLTSLYYYDLSIRKTGLVITSIFKKTALIIPVAVSVLIFGHELKYTHIIGIVLALIAIILMNYQKGSFTKIDYLGILILNIVTGGICDSAKNVFNELCDSSLTNYYITFLFGFAIISTIILIIITKSKIGKYDILYGFAIGIPNYLNAKTFTLALSYVNPVIAFPAYYMLTMLGTALAGIIFFKEKIDIKKIIAMIIIIVALIIINI